MKRILAVYAAFCIGTTHLQAQNQFGMGLLPDKEVHTLVQSKALLTRGDYDDLPEAHSLKSFVPTPQSQGQFGTCTVWSVAYNARTISYAIKKKLSLLSDINRNTFSPGFIYRLIEPQNAECRGSYIRSALDKIKTVGVPKYADFPANCISSVPTSIFTKAEPYKIDQFALLFSSWSIKDEELKINLVKKALSENKPVPFGMHCPGSFQTISGKVWSPTTSEYIEASEVYNGSTNKYRGHAMCIIGYDDAKYGGAFQIVNSWGTDWADDGFVWITYKDFSRFASDAYELIDYVKQDPIVDPTPNPVIEKKPDLSGSLVFIDHVKNQSIPFSRVEVNTRGIEVGGEDDEPVSSIQYSLKGDFEAGFRFRVKFTNNQPAFVYAIGSDLLNNTNRLFPPNNLTSAYLDYSYNNVMLPGDKKFYRLDKNEGATTVLGALQGSTDFYCLLYSKEELNLDAIVQKLKADDSEASFSEKLEKILGNKLVKFKDIKFKEDTIGFDAKSNGKSIVALIVKINRSDSWRK